MIPAGSVTGWLMQQHSSMPLCALRGERRCWREGGMLLFGLAVCMGFRCSATTCCSNQILPLKAHYRCFCACMHCRPHTMLGTAVSIVSISCLAVGSWQWPQAAVTALLQALSSALLMNVSIVGLNQLYDIEIDKASAGVPLHACTACPAPFEPDSCSKSSCLRAAGIGDIRFALNSGLLAGNADGVWAAEGLQGAFS